MQAAYVIGLAIGALLVVALLTVILPEYVRRLKRNSYQAGYLVGRQTERAEAEQESRRQHWSKMASTHRRQA